ncbi:MAG TPA: hypothetical protein VMW63_09025 [Methanoregulaceae archaeon]|nr:hypothetical protein [Methanoregulaceae archaeon]
MIGLKALRSNNIAERRSIIKALVLLLLYLPGLSIVFPVLVSMAADIPLSRTMVLVGSVFLIEYGSVVPGIALGIEIVPLFLIISSVALSVILTSLEIFYLLSTRSDPVCHFLERVRIGKFTGFISQYGVWGLVPGIIVVGFYICPAISWIFSWRRRTCVILMMGGYLAGALSIYLAATGIIRIF